MRVGDVGERAVVAALRRILDVPRADVLVANGDDAAVWLPDGAVAATVDSVVAGVDWLVGRTPPAAIGHRAAAVNLSDLAAMGARPRVLLLALELPADTLLADLLAAVTGLQALAAQHGAAVIGGDLGFSPGPTRWTVTALGTLEGEAMRRDGVQPGDRLWLHGTVGQAALGLAALQAGDAQPDLIARHLWPEPLVAVGQQLRAAGVRAAIDISDGLGLDAARLAAASGVDLHLALAQPRWLTPALAGWLAKRDLDWRAAMAAGGDDYALLCAAPPDRDLAPLGAVPVGGAVAGTGQVALRIADVACAIGGFSHFAGGGTGAPRDLT